MSSFANAIGKSTLPYTFTFLSQWSGSGLGFLSPCIVKAKFHYIELVGHLLCDVSAPSFSSCQDRSSTSQTFSARKSRNWSLTDQKKVRGIVCGLVAKPGFKQVFSKFDVMDLSLI